MRKRHKSSTSQKPADEPGSQGPPDDHEMPRDQGSPDNPGFQGSSDDLEGHPGQGSSDCLHDPGGQGSTDHADDLQRPGGQGSSDYLNVGGGERSPADLDTYQDDDQNTKENTKHSLAPPNKRPRLETDTVEESIVHADYFTNLSLEVICQILEYLPIWDILKLESQCRHLQEAVKIHLRLITDLDFTEGEIHGWMPARFTDSTFEKFMKRCPELMYVYGLHFHQLSRRRQRGFDVLSVPGITEALQHMPHLQGIETSNIFLLEAVLNYLPDVEIMGIFKNRDGAFPIPTHNAISLTKGAQLTSLHLIGVELRDLPRMDFLKKLHLKWVRFTNQNPFKDFTMPCLRTFVINNCAGPQNALKYVPLMTGLVTARNLSRLELVRVPFLGGLIHHVVEDSWRVSGFRNLHRIMLGACKHAQEADLGYLIVTCCAKLEELFIQPSLTKDSFFYSLTHAEVDFPSLSTLHLGFVDSFPEHGKWSQSELVNHGLAEYAESPAFLTDFGMKCVQEVFTSLTSLSLYNCPHLHSPTCWLNPGDFNGFNHVTDLCLCRCHAIRLQDFCQFISLLPCLETLTLEQMFREPPKGCSRVGLSAGTGLGVSSALVSDNGHEPPANQNPHNNQAANNNAVGLGNAANQNHNMADNGDAGDDVQEDSEGELDEEEEDLEDEEEDYEIDVEIEIAKNDGSKQDENNADKNDVSSGMELKKGVVTEGPCSSSDDDTRQRNTAAGENTRADAGGQSSTSGTVSGPDPQHDGELRAECDLPEHAPGCDADSTEANNKTVQENVSQNNDSKIRELLLQEVIDDEDPVEIVEGTGCVEVDGLVWDEEIVEVISGKVAKQGDMMKTDWSLSQSEAGTSNSLYDKDPAPHSDCDIIPGQAGTSDKSSTDCISEAGDDPDLYRDTTHSPTDSHTEEQHMSCARVDSSCSFGKSKGKRPMNHQIPGKPKGKSLWGVKKGIVKKSSQNSSPMRVSRSCQASSEDIRECTKNANLSNKQVSSKDHDKPCACQDVTYTVRSPTPKGADHSNPASEGSLQSSQNPPRKKAGRQGRRKAGRTPTPVMRDQGTSTSDPVIEEDHVQVLSVDCKMLVNINLHHVGITDLIIKECPKLHTLTGFACRVLKNVTIKKATKLGRVSFAQCPKLRHEDLVDEVCSQPPEKYRLIFLRPVKPYSSESLKRQLFGTKSYRYQMCLIHDFSVDPQDSIYNRLRVSVWPDVITNVNFDLIKKGNVRDAAHEECIEGEYPWRQGTYTMQGKDQDNPAKCSWILMSDIPWIQTLAVDSDRNNHNRLSSDSLEGVYSPSAKGHTNVRQAMEVLQQDIKQVIDSKRSLYLHPVIVYVNVCDMNGIVPDMYV